MAIVEFEGQVSTNLTFCGFGFCGFLLLPPLRRGLVLMDVLEVIVGGLDSAGRFPALLPPLVVKTSRVSLTQGFGCRFGKPCTD